MNEDDLWGIEAILKMYESLDYCGKDKEFIYELKNKYYDDDRYDDYYCDEQPKRKSATTSGDPQVDVQVQIEKDLKKIKAEKARITKSKKKLQKEREALEAEKQQLAKEREELEQAKAKFAEEKEDYADQQFDEVSDLMG